jgi:N-6 DNA Methylase
MANDPQTRAAIAAHDEWLGFVQPVGLVVAPPVLVSQNVIIDRNIRSHQERLDALLSDDDTAVTDIRSLFVEVLGWEDEDLVDPAPEQRIRLPELDVTLEPTWQIKDREGAPQLLVRCEPVGTELDKPVEAAADGWTAPPQIRFERLLRETGIPTGLLCTPQAVRLVHAPAGETSGHITFRIADMAQVMGRPILAAFNLLLGEFRMFRAEPRERLGRLLTASREAQNLVSTRLARQVLGALHELLRGFVTTDARRTDGTSPISLLAEHDPQRLYAGLVTVLMRLVFVLYAEERDLMPADALYEENYGLRGLFKKLRDDAARHGDDLMDSRYGAWARLSALFRLIHAGGGREGFRFTARKGRLFDPGRFPFLEGRANAEEPLGALPLLSDGTIWRVLERLLVLDGECLSYRTLDVEEIGSVYQAVMGFRIEQRLGCALVLRSRGHHGAGIIVDIDALLAVKPSERKKRLTELEVAALTSREEKAVSIADSIEALADALSGKVDNDATPVLAPAGQPLLQATDERRRSGSHYTPRSLTQPIVAETLRPILERLGPRATPEQILELRVLDPAMGSGAFLVEACRQLAEALVRSWEAHAVKPEVPPDEDALLYAKRFVVQRCIYGVDRNELAAELGKLSLWLATLARGHEFSFLDHCIRHGDSLVGLDRLQLEALTWVPETSEAPLDLLHILVRDRLAQVKRERERIRAALDDATEDQQRLVLARADQALADPKLVGDAVVAAFFSADKATAREKARLQVRGIIEQAGTGWQEQLKPAVAALRNGTPTVVPFHWPLEFPEVFDRDNPGFDAIVGNPPFAGKNTTILINAEQYPDWLQMLHEGAHGNSDLVAHFFRRAYGLLREAGCLGLLATNTIRQGDTRGTGLRPIRQASGTIYTARRRYKWPGCFENFPFPSVVEGNRTLAAVGDEYYDFRAALMIEYDEGLTMIYNRFHDPDERSNAIGELRRLHDAMDRAVLDAYGWTDIRPTCEFELDWEDDEAENGRRRRKPWRYRWPEPVRDEVLARLLALNAQRAEEERLALGDR